MKYIRNIIFLSLFPIFLFGCHSNSNQTANEFATAETAAQAPPKPADSTSHQKVILFFGNSLTAGYGLDPAESFPSIIQQKLDSLGYHYKVVNAGLSGETSASGNNRLNWVLERQPVDIFVLELGANDGLRGIDPAETRKNLEEMIEKVRKSNPEAKIILAGMMVPPNMGSEYSDTFSRIFPEVAREKKVKLIPFLLDGVAGEPELNQADGIHPTTEGAKIVADNVWAVLKEVITVAS